MDRVVGGGGATVASKKLGQEAALAKSPTNVLLPYERVTVQRTLLAPKTRGQFNCKLKGAAALLNLN